MMKLLYQIVNEEEIENYQNYLAELTVFDIHDVFRLPLYERLIWFTKNKLTPNEKNRPICIIPMSLVKTKKVDLPFKWNCTCGKTLTAAGAFLQQYRISMEKLLKAIYLWTINTEEKEIVNQANLSKNTVTRLCIHLREICLEKMANIHEQIGGVDASGIPKIVEIDESVITSRKYHRGRLVETQWVFGGIERGTKNCFLIPVPNRSAETLLRIINEKIRPGSIIVSDGWRSYRALSESPNYTH